MLLVVALFSSDSKAMNGKDDKEGNYRGVITHGNFSDEIDIEIKSDSKDFEAYFTSLAQNAFRIPFQKVEVKGDSISFMLQSDFYAYVFKSKWIEGYTKLQGSLVVDTVTVAFTLDKHTVENVQSLKSEEVTFNANGANINGTIWYPENKSQRALIIVTSSGNSDRSASRAEAMLMARVGMITFHYDKRGTGSSEGDWGAASIDELSADDIEAIKFFSKRSGIPLRDIGIKGSSQGASKVPLILNQLSQLKYGIVVSCPGVTLLASDLNYWKNRNAEALGAHIDKAAELQGKVFEFIAGLLPQSKLSAAINENQSEPWFKQVWVPDLDQVQEDRKLKYSPIPEFEKTNQPLLIIQGTKDEIIPANSHQLISNALKKANNSQVDTRLLESASHSINYLGVSDFPYWSKLHPDYLKIIQKWIEGQF